MQNSVSGHPPHLLGIRGEALAAKHLRERGWTIVERNYRLGRREIDLIVMRGETLAFVEVKTRSGRRWGLPEEAVTARKRRDIEAVASAFLARTGPGDMDIRFDVVSIEIHVGQPVHLEHITDAWRP